MTRQRFIAVIFLVAAATALHGQERITGANYPLAQKFTPAFVKQHVTTAAVAPEWIGKTDVFWYAAGTPTGTKYWKVDPAKKEKTPLFDHVILAAALSEAAKKPLDAESLNLTRVTVAESGKTLTFVFGENRYEFDLVANKMKALGKAPAQNQGALTPAAIEQLRQQLGDERVNEILRKQEDEQKKDDEKKEDVKKDEEQKKEDVKKDEEQKKEEQKKGGKGGGFGKGGQGPGPAPTGPDAYKAFAPDKKQYVYAFKHNLYLVPAGETEDKAIQVTKDGVEEYSFAGGGGGFGGLGKGGDGKKEDAPKADRKTRPNVTWSSDSKSFYVSRTDGRGVKDLYLVDSIATPRPTLEQYKYPMPGEAAIRKPELHYYDAAKKEVVRVTPKWKDEQYSDTRWGKTAGELRFIRRDRLQRNLEICALDVATGTCKCLFGEAFDSAFLDFQMPRYVEETDEMLWWSERSGWGHLYRYGRDGTFKNAVTAGPWRVGRIDAVDAKNQLIYFVGNAREPGENLYYTHLYRVKFDGTGLTCLDPSVTPSGLKAAPGFNQTSTMSPTKKFVVTNSTRMDHAPFATVRDDTGSLVMLLEETDTSRLEATGWKPPETFVVKAADGVTDLYGNMWKPFDFDPKRKYPIIVYVYPGPQTEGVDYRFTAYSSYMQLSQLGFIVIQVGHRGGSPLRSKAYHSFGYFNLRDYGLVDKKAAIEALAARHSFIDIEKVGIYGHSGGGFMSAAALLQKPYNEFFKAAVASAGNHDNNIYNNNWSERYHGLKEVAAGDEKKTATEGGFGKGGFGKGGGGKGGKKGELPIEEELEEELIDLINSIDPQDDQAVLELQKKIAELNARLAELKKGTTQTEAVGQAPPPRTAGTPPAKDDAPILGPVMRFDIRVPTNAELAANLKGHLMLVHGEIDNNVHPANTMRLVDSLIKANKRFDLIIIPGARHGFGVAQPYFTQRMWDFFAEHLLSDRQTGADLNNKDVKRK